MLALVFPGQGSQAVGMSMDFRERYAEAREVFEEADDALGAPLSDWIAQGPESRLERTEVTQPAVLVASVAILRVVESRLSLAASYLAGHSLGEYTALVAAGALPLSDAVRLVRRRGSLMQEAVPEGAGAMSAVIGLPGEEVARICEGIDGLVTPANFNSPVQTVIAGESAAVAAAGQALTQAGAKKIQPLAVSAPFHCALMAPAMEKLGPTLAEVGFWEARTPVVSNVTAEPYRDPLDARRLLREQVCAPVRWVDSVQRMRRDGVTFQLELGPGRVLSGLAAKIDRELARANVACIDDVEPALERVAEALA